MTEAGPPLPTAAVSAVPRPGTLLAETFPHAGRWHLAVYGFAGRNALQTLGLLLTIVVSFATIVFIWVVSFPIGIYSATHQYSWGDYGLSFLGFLTMAVGGITAARKGVRQARAVKLRPSGRTESWSVRCSPARSSAASAVSASSWMEAGSVEYPPDA